MGAINGLDANARKFRELRETVRRTGEQFLRTELEMTRSLLDVGDTTSDPSHRRRSYQDAASGYRTVAHILPRLSLSSEKTEEILARLRSLRNRFAQKGVSIEEVPSTESAT